MDESSHQHSLPTSHLLGSVPAVVGEDKNITIYEGGNGGQQASNWKGMFNIASYSQYFDVDTDIVVNRLMSSLSPTSGDFFSIIDANPDFYKVPATKVGVWWNGQLHGFPIYVTHCSPHVIGYGLLWISTTLVFVAASMGNWASYLSATHGGGSWRFDVGYVSTAAWSVYGYTLLVPTAFYFLLRYMGSDARLVHLWCMWGYSLFAIVLSSFPLVLPVEALRWAVVALAGGLSSWFVARNLKLYIIDTGVGNDIAAVVIVVASFIIQLAMAVFIRAYFFS